MDYVSQRQKFYYFKNSDNSFGNSTFGCDGLFQKLVGPLWQKGFYPQSTFSTTLIEASPSSDLLAQ
jgi:hypothetical protein